MIELILSHDGVNWIAENGELYAAAGTLERLDEVIGQMVQSDRRYTDTGIQQVMMRFNNATIPGWIRQYMPHYFNRMIKVRT